MAALVFKKEDDPDVFRLITDKNLLRQFDFLKTLVEVSLVKSGCIVTQEIILDLNRYAVVLLTPTPGEYRKEAVHITNARHMPPPHEEVPGWMDEFVNYLSANWDSHSASHLSAYALWRLCWVHPFMEGNGRTARAMSYLMLCMKHGMWLPGTNIIPMQIKKNLKPYYESLQDADHHYQKNGEINVTTLEQYLDGLLTIQLAP